jgi:hypothetical protein
LEFKNTAKMFLQNNSVKTYLQKKTTKKSKPKKICIFLIMFLGVSRWGEFKNTIKKISNKYLTNSVTFLASEEPTNHVKVRHFFLRAPCAQKQGTGSFGFQLLWGWRGLIYTPGCLLSRAAHSAEAKCLRFFFGPEAPGLRSAPTTIFLRAAASASAHPHAGPDRSSRTSMG